MKNLIYFGASLLVLTFASCRKYNNVQPILRLNSFIEEFSDNRNEWQFADGQNLAYGIISNGTFKVDYNDNFLEAYYVSKAINFNIYNNFTLNTRIGSNKNMGLLFGFDKSRGANGYSFTVDHNGFFALYDEGGNGNGADISTIVSPTYKPFVRSNGDWNELQFEQNGNRWIGYINNNQVFNIPIQNLKSGNVGFVVLSNTQGEADYLQAEWYE